MFRFFYARINGKLLPLIDSRQPLIDSRQPLIERAD